MRLVFTLLVCSCSGIAQTTDTNPAPANPGSAVTSTAPKPQEKGHITGQVVNESTGEPLRKATILAYSRDGSSTESLEATTDAAGKYHLDDLGPGKYTVSASRNGFVRASFGAKSFNGAGTILSVGAGGTAEANFKLIPHSVVTGRVLDEDAEPLPQVQIHLSRFMWQNGRRTLIPSGTALTNDLGEYRIFGVGPGKYFLSATYNPRGYNQSRAAADVPDTSYPATYYPGTTDARSATRLEVPKAGHLSGVDLTLQKARSYRVTGVLRSTVPGQSKPTGVMVMLTPKSDEQSNGWEMNKSKQSDADGKFTFDGVLPGDYEVTGNSFGGDGIAAAHQEISVSRENVSGVILTLAPGWDMKGILRIDGEAPGVNLSQVHLMLDSEQAGTVMRPRSVAIVKDDGSFTFKDVSAERYRVQAWGLPDGYYLKSARAGSSDLLEKAADFGTLQGASIEVVISPKGAVAEGSVKDDKGDLVTNGTVVLVPEAGKRSNHALFKQASPDQYGHFKMSGVTPGSYSLYAFQDVERGIWEDPDFLKTVEKSGVDVTLAEGSDEVQELKVIVGNDN